MMKNFLRKFSRVSLGLMGIGFAFVAVFVPLRTALADTGYVPLTTIPGAFTENTPVNPVNVVKNIYGVSIGIAALLAVAMIVWAGVEYVTTEAIEGKSNAKEKWEGAIWGLVLLLGAYIILRTINVSLVNIDLSNLTKSCGTGATQSGVPCGTAATTANALGDLVKTANDAATAYQNAQGQVATAQTAVAAAQKDLDSAKASGDPAQIAAAQSKLTDATNQLSMAKTDASFSRLDAATQQGSLQIAQQLAGGNIDTAKQRQTEMINIMRTEIGNLAASGNVAPGVVKQATAEMVIAQVNSDQTIDISSFTKDIFARQAGLGSTNIDAARIVQDAINPTTGLIDIAKVAPTILTTTTINDSATQQEAIDLRSSLAKSSNDTINTLKDLSPGKVDSFTQTALGNITKLDSAISAALGCKNGYVPTTQPPLTCKP